MGNFLNKKERSTLEFPLLDMENEVNNFYQDNIIDFLETLGLKLSNLDKKLIEIDKKYNQNLDNINEKINNHIFKLSEENIIIKNDLSLLLENDKILRQQIENLEKTIKSIEVANLSDYESKKVENHQSEEFDQNSQSDSYNPENDISSIFID